MAALQAGAARLGSIAVTGALLLATVPAGAQSDEQRAAARHIAIEGVQAFQKGQWKTAIERLERAEAVMHAPTHLLYLARAHEKLGRLLRARELYLKITRESLPASASKAFREAQAAARTEAQAIEKRIAYVLIALPDAPPKTRVLVDGKEVPPALVGVRRPIDPGARHLEAIAPDGRRVAVDVTIDEGSEREVKLRIEDGGASEAPGLEDGPSAEGDSSAASGPGVLPLVAFGVGAVGLGVGTAFALKSSSKRSEADTLFDECGGSKCLDADPRSRRIAALDDEARNAQTLSAVGFVVGGLGIAGGVALLFLKDTGSEAAGSSVRPFIGVGSVGATGRF